MEKSKTYFEQVPIEIARNIAERERALGTAKPFWQTIARRVMDEPDPHKVLRLVEELNAALDTGRGVS